jgi:hypothetical protein
MIYLSSTSSHCFVSYIVILSYIKHLDKKWICKVFPVHIIKAIRRCGDITPLNLNLATLIWKTIPIPIELEAGWHLELAWTFWIRKNLLSLPRFKPLEHPACNVVTILTVLSQFNYLLAIIEAAKVSFYLFCLQTSQLFDIGNVLN